MAEKTKIPTPEKNIYWRDIPSTMPVYERHYLFVAGDGDDAAVVFWHGQEATQAQNALKKRAADTASGAEIPTYRIVRFFCEEGKRRKVMQRGLTREEAKAHCSDPTSKGDGWFEGFEEE